MLWGGGGVLWHTAKPSERSMRGGWKGKSCEMRVGGDVMLRVMDNLIEGVGYHPHKLAGISTQTFAEEASVCLLTERQSVLTDPKLQLLL